MRSLTNSSKQSGWASKKVFDRYKMAQEIKAPWESLYDDVFRYFIPNRQSWGRERNVTPDMRVLFTSLGITCANEYINTMQEIMFPPQSSGMDLEAGKIFEHMEKFKTKKDSMNRELAKVNRLTNELKNLSNFDIAFSEACADLFAGTACLMITRGNDQKPVAVRAIPLNEFFINEGADGEVSEFYRKFKRTKTQLQAMWSDMDEIEEDDENKQLEVLEVCYLCDNTWFYELYMDADKKRVLQRKSKTSPFQCVRWNKSAGDVWGCGVGVNALNDMKTYNAFVEASLRASAFEAPMFEVVDDGTFNVSEIVLQAGSVIGVPATDTGDPRIRQIQINTQQPNSRIDMELLEISIKRQCLADTLPDSAMGKGKTATEVMEITRSLRKNFTSVFGRLINWQYGIVRRFFEVTVSMGFLRNDETFSPMIESNQIDGLWFAVSMNTPLTRQLAIGDVQAQVNTITVLAQLDPSMATLYKSIKMNELVYDFADKMGISHEFLYTPQEMAENERKMAQAQQQQVVQEKQLEVESETAIAKGKEEAKLGNTRI